MRKTDLKKSFLKFHRELPSSLRKRPLYFGVSGGLDSSVLAAVGLELRDELPPIHWLHVNYGLRIPDCDEEEAMLREWAGRHQVSLRVRRLRLEGKPANLQAWARTQRFRFFHEVIRKTSGGRGLVLLAHHQQDQAETVLARLIRGSSLAGVGGMSPLEEISRLSRRELLSPLLILRPFLEVSKDAIERYAQSHSVSYREDASNQSDVYQRNRIRHRLLPLMLEENPRLLETLGEFSRKARRGAEALEVLAERWLKRHMKRQGRSARLDLPALRKLPLGLVEKVFESFLASIETQPQALSRILPELISHVLSPRGDRKLTLRRSELYLSPLEVMLKPRGSRKSFARTRATLQNPN